MDVKIDRLIHSFPFLMLTGIIHIDLLVLGKVRFEAKYRLTELSIMALDGVAAYKK